LLLLLLLPRLLPLLALLGPPLLPGAASRLPSRAPLPPDADAAPVLPAPCGGDEGMAWRTRPQGDGGQDRSKPRCSPLPHRPTRLGPGQRRVERGSATLAVAAELLPSYTLLSVHTALRRQ
jgi:hypothetical protein